MKHARKLASLLLALVMVFALAVTVAADDTGSITVNNPVANQEYKAYKIFDVVYDTAKKHYSYTIDGGDSKSPWYDTVSAYATTEANGLKLTQVEGTNTYVVTTTSDFSPADFAVALKAAVGEKAGTELTAQADGTASVSGLPLGYYFVTSTSGALCNLTTTDPNAKIYDKTDVPFKKEANKTNDDVGQTVTYTITGNVPDYTGFDTYTYLITDTMSEGLTYTKGSVTVMVGDADAKSACTIAENVDSNANKFTVSIPVKDYPIGAKIVVTYTATINEKAVVKISNNEATLTYSDDPTHLEHKTTTPPQKVDVYSSKIAIVKVEKLADGATETPKKLKDAKFVLYKEVPTEGVAEATKMYYKWNDTDKKVDWVADKSQADVKATDVNGEASFDGLADGTYYLVETKAPAGYNQLDKPVKVEVHVGENAGAVTSDTQLTVTTTVKNQAGTLLPSTGGMGTTIFYVLGAVLVVGAGVLLVTKKRMSQSDI